MLVHKITKSSYQRLLINDKSESFTIIIKVHYAKKVHDNLEIQKQIQIVINTTLNKARVLSGLINEEYIKNPNINSYILDLKNLLQNENHKSQIEQIINIFSLLLANNGEDVIIPENSRNLFHQILSVLKNENENEMNKQIMANNVVECKYLYNNKLNGIISYIQQITYDVVDGSNDHLRLWSSGSMYEHPLRNIIRYDKKNIENYYAYNTPDHNNVYYNFVNRKINITGYTIRVPQIINEYHMPKTWMIIGSNDEKEWTLIDMKENNNEINNENRCVYFECTNTVEFFKYIRFKKVGLPVFLSAIEFFGYIST